MRKMLWAGALMSLALMTSTAATGADKQLAVGSAKTDVDVAVVTEAPEHASFSAHSTGNGCEATGHVSYKGFLFGPAAPPVDVEVDVTQLVIAGNAALFGGLVTKDNSDSGLEGEGMYFNASDSGLAGGTGDTFAWEALASPTRPCAEAFPGHPITSGNVVIKADPLP